MEWTDILWQWSRAIFGMAALIGITYLFSLKKQHIDWHLVWKGLVLQLVLAFLMLKVPFISEFFNWVVKVFVWMIDSTVDAARFMFGDLANAAVGEKFRDTGIQITFGFAFFVLPTILFFAAFSQVLYYYGVLQRVVELFARFMRRFMRMTGAESLAVAANVFIGQTEAPLVVKPYLEKMSRSEIMLLMTGGMATIAGGVFGAYMSMLGGTDPEQLRLFGKHLLTASIISAPAAVVAAKIILPETEKDVLREQDARIPRDIAGSNFLDALTRGTTDGLRLAVNVGAMIITFMALVYLSNRILHFIGEVTPINDWIAQATNGTFKDLSLQSIFGLLFAPIAWIIGVNGADLLYAGQMLGEKMVLNEFFAYYSLSELKHQGILDPHTIIIMTYALCGFANFGSIGIQIGGIGAIAPGQRQNLARLGFLAMIGGTLACLYTATIAGMLHLM